MTKLNIILTISFLLLAGCVSDSEFLSSQRKIQTLQDKLISLENDISLMKNELSIAKKQRPIRLPTGSPILVNSKKNINSKESNDYTSAIEAFKSGNIDDSISKLKLFNTNYPSSKYRANTLYYLGKANYTKRNYPQAEQIMEQVIYQTPLKNSEKAVKLLINIYQIQGKSAKIKQLDKFINSKKYN